MVNQINYGKKILNILSVSQLVFVVYEQPRSSSGFNFYICSGLC